jgi:hypothetical protein
VKTALVAGLAGQRRGGGGSSGGFGWQLAESGPRGAAAGALDKNKGCLRVNSRHTMSTGSIKTQ